MAKAKASHKNTSKASAFNFVQDHLTMLVDAQMYKIMYAFLRVVMGLSKKDIIYEKRKRWDGASSESSMTFAMRLGDIAAEKNAKLGRTMLAVVQPTEPAAQSSHVRDILSQHVSCAHFQHIALRTPDLIGFHKHALEHGVNFITPIMREKEEDLLQVFSGEFYRPGARPTGVFFEFVQREVTPALLARLKKMDRQSWFRDKTFLGLYGQKEQEYQSGNVTPIWDHVLMEQILEPWKDKQLWEITESDLEQAAVKMKAWAARKQERGAPALA